MTYKKTAFWVVLSLTTLTFSCREKTILPDGNPVDTEVNTWIYDNMKTWYFWNDKLPASPNLRQEPQAFFQSLLYRYDGTLRPDGDRFSWMQESADELKAALSGETTSNGLEFRIIRYTSSSDDVFGVVTYVVLESPAHKAGFKRGDFFTHVNGQKLNTSNYRSLLYEGTESKTFTLGTLDAENRVVSAETTRAMASAVIQSNPVYFDTTFVRGDKRVGYLVYHQFIPGPNGSEVKSYDRELERVFSGFKDRRVNELIIDFRYNRGGYVSSASEIASLIGKGVTANDVFYYKEYNKTVTPDLEKQYGKDFFSGKFLTKPQNIGSQLNRVVFLTSGSTASASELVINGLKPFMDVVLVGSKTTGKNVGSITLSDNTKRIKWGIQPIVSRSSNSQRNSDYTAGFEPTISRSEGTRLYPYGDARDPLLAEALGLIYGTTSGRLGVGDHDMPRVGPEVHSSIDRKAGGGNMFFEH